MLRPLFIFVSCLFSYATLLANEGMLDEEVTRAEVLDLSSWMSDDVEVNPLLMGAWQTETLGVIEIVQMPFAKNACFVQTRGRMVPAFQVDVGEQHYFVIGMHASEQLELVPEVYECVLSEENMQLEISRLEWSSTSSSFESMQDFVRFVGAEKGEVTKSPNQFKRI